MWVLAKRLEKGTFFWPKLDDPAAKSIAMTNTELTMLPSEVDLSQAKRRRWYRRDAPDS